MGPFIPSDTVNAERYLSMLREEILPVINTWENIEDLIFMQDGAPPHFAIVAREWLNAHFPQRWTGHDLTPCDFFLWAWLKEHLYSTKPLTLEGLEGRLREVMSAIPQEFFVKSVDAVTSRQSPVSLRSWWQMLPHISNLSKTPCYVLPSHVNLL